MLKVSGEREMKERRPALSDSAHILNPNKTKKHWEDYRQEATTVAETNKTIPEHGSRRMGW
jgi:hypothetical protein